MSWNSKKKKENTNYILAVVCVILTIILGVILINDSRIQKKETASLMELAENEKKGIEDYETVKKRADALAKQSEELLDVEEDASSEESEDKKDASEEKESDQTEESK